MKSLKQVIFLILMLNLTIFNFSLSQNETTRNTVHLLVLTDDQYGSSFVFGDEKIKSIKQQFEDFGWKMTIAAIKDTILPCDWGEKTLGTEAMIVSDHISDIDNLSGFNAIVIIPGRGFSNLLQNDDVLNLLRQANVENMIIAAWCRGVRLLAAADIIEGKNIIGHFDYFEEYKNAGANYVEYSFKFEDGKKIFNNVTPPIRDGNIITTVRSLYYRNEMCELIKSTIDEKLESSNH